MPALLDRRLFCTKVFVAAPTLLGGAVLAGCGPSEIGSVTVKTDPNGRMGPPDKGKGARTKPASGKR